MIVARITTGVYTQKPRPPGRIRMVLWPDGRVTVLQSRPASEWQSQYPRDGVAEILNDRDFLYPH